MTSEKKKLQALLSYHKRKNDPDKIEKNKIKYKLQWDKRKNDPEFIEKKRKLDAYYRLKKASDPEFLKKEQERQRKRREESPESFMVTTARQRAKIYNLPCDITKEDIVVPTHCPVFGFKLEVAKGRQTKSSPSLDKIIPSLGYVKGNIQVLSSKANLMKQDCTKEELLMFADWINRTYRD